MGGLRPAAALSAAFACTAVLAASGTVRDDRGRALAGAQACLVIDHVEVLCVTTVDNGYYRLPGGDAKGATVRITAAGFLPLEVAPVDQTAAIVLRRGAAFAARLVDFASGSPISEGQVWILEPTGRRVGPFPVNRAGVEVSPFPPGRYRLQAEVPGWITEVVEVDFVAGEKRAIEVRMKREAGGAGGR